MIAVEILTGLTRDELTHEISDLKRELRDNDREIGRLKVLCEHLEFENQHLRNEVERLQKQPRYAEIERMGIL